MSLIIGHSPYVRTRGSPLQNSHTSQQPLHLSCACPVPSEQEDPELEGDLSVRVGREGGPAAVLPQGRLSGEAFCGTEVPCDLAGS